MNQIISAPESDALYQITCLCTAVRRMDRVLNHVYDEALRPSGLLTTQYSLLSTLSRAQHPLALSQLAEIQVMDRTSLTRALAPLTNRGLIKVEAGEDRRLKLVSLTEAGRTALEEARPLWREVQERVVATAGHDQYQTTMNDITALLSKLRS